MEGIGMLPIVSIDEIARTNALVLANIFSQNKEVVDPKAPQNLTKSFSKKEMTISKALQKILTRYFEKPKEIWEFISPVEIEFLLENT